MQLEVATTRYSLLSFYVTAVGTVFSRFGPRSRVTFATLTSRAPICHHTYKMLKASR